MQPKGEDVLLKIEKMYNESSVEIENAHGGTGKNVMLGLENEVEEKSILFKVKE